MIQTDRYPAPSEICEIDKGSLAMSREANLQRARVSVVLIFLNEARFLQEAMDSILSQAFRSWELLLVDDGSTDGSTEIAKTAARRLPYKVHYYEHAKHANRGKSASRNMGLKHGKGEFVLFLDGDDVVTPNALSEQVALMEEHPEVGMVYGPIQSWFRWDGNPDEQGRDVIQHLALEADRVIKAPAIVPIFLRNEGVIPQGNLFRTLLVREVGGFEDEFRELSEDQVFRVKFCLRYPIYASSRVWYKYRQHDASSCAQAVKTNRFYEARRIFLQWTENFCRHSEVGDADVWKAIKEGLRPYRFPRLSKIEKRMAHYKAWLIWRMIAIASPVVRRAFPKPIRERIWNRLSSMKSLQGS